jgi:hypothetical protein
MMADNCLKMAEMQAVCWDAASVVTDWPLNVRLRAAAGTGKTGG